MVSGGALNCLHADLYFIKAGGSDPAGFFADQVASGQVGSTKLSITRLGPAFSKSISSLLPSIAVIAP